MKSQKELNKDAWEAMKNHPLFRGCVIIFVLLLSLLLLGFGFFTIFQGIFLVFFKIGPYYPPIYKLLQKALNVSSLPSTTESVPITIWKIPSLVLWIGVIGACFYSGFYILFHSGFLAQNLIWLILKK